MPTLAMVKRKKDGKKESWGRGNEGDGSIFIFKTVEQTSKWPFCVCVWGGAATCKCVEQSHREAQAWGRTGGELPRGPGYITQVLCVASVPSH